MIARRLASGLICAVLVTASSGEARRAGADRTAGPFDLLLFATAKAPHAVARARLVYATSPFGVAVTADGRASYDIEITASGLPAPASLGPYTVYVAWAATPDLATWVRLGTVTNGTSTVGVTDFNKFLLVISAEGSAATASQSGPTVLHGTSPSGYLQSFLGHPIFRGVPQ